MKSQITSRRSRRIAVLVGVVVFLSGGFYQASAEDIPFAPQKNTTSPGTLKNMIAVYDEEMNMFSRYMAYAERADKERYKGVGSLYRATAFAEAIHAGNHLAAIKNLGGDPEIQIHSFRVGSTIENLDDSVVVEKSERFKLYPEYIKTAQAENIMGPVQTLQYAKKSDSRHVILFRSARRHKNEWKEKRTFYVCNTCGYTDLKLPGRNCPVCGEETRTFEVIK